MLTDRTLPRGLLFFWSVWTSLVTLTNLLDGLKSLRILPPTWAFASGNYAYMASVTARYHTPGAVTATLFTGVVLWEALASFLLWRAFAAYGAGGRDVGTAVRNAFTVSIALWCAFAITDEIFFVFDAESTHLRLFVAQLVTLFTLHWFGGVAMGVRGDAVAAAASSADGDTERRVAYSPQV
jgi:hypothetical protein